MFRRRGCGDGWGWGGCGWERALFPDSTEIGPRLSEQRSLFFFFSVFFAREFPNCLCLPTGTTRPGNHTGNCPAPVMKLGPSLIRVQCFPPPRGHWDHLQMAVRSVESFDCDSVSFSHLWLLTASFSHWLYETQKSIRPNVFLTGLQTPLRGHSTHALFSDSFRPFEDHFAFSRELPRWIFIPPCVSKRSRPTFAALASTRDLGHRRQRTHRLQKAIVSPPSFNTTTAL
ncbi:hypothetical protein F5148DRAFT_435869 [Russula earlei]|uniref:Uncharacterized protein n=1 Tax=Russula earlei TaxID=71964 RepID=A0ACC0UHI1_9AGAM|nr:hypothetical protein F5148DRAFT_435869 [Russula earlei]